MAEGMQTLLMAGLEKVRNGRTTLSELFRVIELDEVDGNRADSCPNCKGSVEPDFLACPICEHHLAPACPSCDRRVMAHWKVCPYCCDKLNQTKKASPEPVKGPAPRKPLEKVPAVAGGRG
jgi:hypothetical protein